MKSDKSETTSKNDTTSSTPAPKRKRAPRKKAPAKGLGDTIEKVTEATGIKAVVKAVAGDDCGCKERKEKLNRLFPYHSSLRMTEEQKAVWNNVIDPDYKRGRLQRTSKVALEKMYKDMGAPVKIGGCPSCARKALKRMEAIYQASCETS